MLALISPAKTLDFDSQIATDSFSQADHLSQSRRLIQRMKQFSGQDLSRLMKVSSAIAELNVDRFRHWKTPFNESNSRQAIFAFKGDVYIGLDPHSMDDANLSYAQQHVRVLSGLYGLLRPLDLIQAYRLEMGTRVDIGSANNLYQFWDDKITRAINKQLKDIQSEFLINLSSNEYFKSVQLKKLKATVITPVFKDFKNEEYKVIGFFAKKARGAMARYMIDNELKDPEQLKLFNWEGYEYHAGSSTDAQWIFTRR
jgi:uncharacterized protein